MTLFNKHIEGMTTSQKNRQRRAAIVNMDKQLSRRSRQSLHKLWAKQKEKQALIPYTQGLNMINQDYLSKMRQLKEKRDTLLQDTSIDNYFQLMKNTDLSKMLHTKLETNFPNASQQTRKKLFKVVIQNRLYSPYSNRLFTTKLLQELEKNHPRLKDKALYKQQYISKPPIPSQVMKYLKPNQAAKLVLNKSLRVAHATSKPELRQLDTNMLKKMKNKELFLRNLGVFRNSLQTIRLHGMPVSRGLNQSEIRALIDVLPNLTNLREFQITDSILADDKNSFVALADALGQLPQLKKLTLINNAIDDEGAIALVIALKNLTHLTHLDISVNEMGDEETIALSDVLHHLTQLKHLNLSENDIGSEGAIALASAVRHLNHLQSFVMDGNNIRDQATITAVTNMLSHISHLSM